jgi:hypothetical protein
MIDVAGQELQQVWVFEGNDNGRFRIRLGDEASEWTSHKSIATMEHGGRLYAAASAYFEGVLPAEVVFEVAVVPTTLGPGWRREAIGPGTSLEGLVEGLRAERARLFQAASEEQGRLVKAVRDDDIARQRAAGGS